MKNSKIYFNKVHVNAIKDIAKFFGIKFELHVGNKESASAYVLLISEKIVVRTYRELSVSDLFSMFFHELAHIQCKHQGKYPLYHRANPMFLSKKLRRYFLSTAWRAELYTENESKKLMKIFFPGIPHTNGYSKSNKNQFAPGIRQDFINYFKHIDELAKKVRLEMKKAKK